MRWSCTGRGTFSINVMPAKAGTHDTMPSAIQREKRLKKWNSAWKVRRINEVNPQWTDLWHESGEILTHGPGGRSPPDPTEEQIR